jgi:hypothetical protein
MFFYSFNRMGFWSDEQGFESCNSFIIIKPSSYFFTDDTPRSKNRVPVSRKGKVTAHFRIVIEQVDYLIQQNPNLADIMNNLTDGKRKVAHILFIFSQWIDTWLADNDVI